MFFLRRTYGVQSHLVSGEGIGLYRFVGQLAFWSEESQGFQLADVVDVLYLLFE